jgi:thiol-disulfide isomerase/thioredoxin/predicted pyridoxine 5'-phosphate oxidase superfamily flavin-nucleotide-binding protein
MMKMTLSTLVCVATLICATNKCHAQREKKTKPSAQIASYAALNGTVSDMQDGIVTIGPITERTKRDTVKVIKGKFNYKTTISYPQAYAIAKQGGADALCFLEAGTYTLRLDVTGTPTAYVATKAQQSMDNFNAQFVPLITERNTLQQAAQKLPGDSMQRAMQVAQTNIQNMFDKFMQDPKQHPAVQAFIYLSNAESSQDGAMLGKLYEGLPAVAKLHKYAVMGYQASNRATADDMGKIAPDFTLKDSSGKPVTLSSYRGKNYVLVDFWATWCGPCRAEFPALIEAQKKYASKGLVILGVSIDKDYNAWKGMLAKPNFTTWTHVWDGPQGPEQVVNTLYNVPSIPRNFLLDKNGKVIARNLRGSQVEQTLEQLLK